MPFRLVAVVFGLVCYCATSAHAAPITFFSFSLTQRFTTEDVDFQPNGTTSSAAISQITTNVTAVGSASADLSTGDLKALSLTQAGAGAFSFDVESIAAFGDSFRTISGGGPFVWNDTTATMTLDITGLVELMGANQLNYSGIFFLVLPPGVLDAYANGLGNNDDALLESAVGQAIYQDQVRLGPGSPEQGVPMVETYPATINFTFAPGSDFDWAIVLELTTNASNGSKALADFANTIGVSYAGPAGTTTLSASGVFPGTQAAAETVPEPATLALLAAGLGAIVVRRRALSR